MNKKIAEAVTKLDDLTVKKLGEAFAMDCTVTEVCLFAGISRQTYYTWIKDDPELSDRFEQLRDYPVLKARKTVVDSLDQPENAHWYLSRKRRGEFATREEHTGADGRPILDELVDAVKEIIKRE